MDLRYKQKFIKNIVISVFLTKANAKYIQDNT